MALRLGEYLAYGELFNVRKHSVHGWLGLMGLECRMQLELSGDCEPDLAGKRFRFRVRHLPEQEFDEQSVPRFQARQIGPTGKITAALRVRVDAAGVPVPPGAGAVKDGAWKRCLHIEWFGQNGRVVIELIDPVIEVVPPDQEDDGDEFFGALFPDGVEPPVDGGPPPDSFAGVTDLFEDPDSPSFSPTPAGLQRELDRRAAEVDRAVFGEDEISRDIREMELMDDLIEHEEGVPLASIIDGTGPLPDPDSLNENQAACALKVLLAHLAVNGIAVDMCEHVTALDTYRLIRDEIGSEGHCYRELRGTGWVQHFSTYEHCKVCEAEFDREWEVLNAPDDDDDPPMA